MSENPIGKPQCSLTSSVVNRITKHTYFQKNVPNCTQYGHRRHASGEK